MTVEQEAEQLIKEAREITPHSEEKIIIEIAIWCIGHIRANIGLSLNDEFYDEVKEYLINKLKRTQA